MPEECDHGVYRDSITSLGSSPSAVLLERWALKAYISIEESNLKPIEELNVEMVERKGRGHPDYMADGVAESFSRALSKYYRKRFGRILHHNVDKGIVVGGRSHPVFGGGEVEEPIYILVAGRATTSVREGGNTVSVPFGTISLRAAKDFLRKNFRFLDVDHDVVIDYRVKPGSVDLVKIFQAGDKAPLSNDTSFGVCFAPLSQTERLVLETELYLNSPKLKDALPEVGEDVKVMGLRRDKSIDLTVAAAMISSLTPDADHYLSVKEEVKDRIADLATKITEYPVKVFVNTGDKPERGSFYITVTGTSAEQGDDGNTGRGNRVHGLITPCRPMSLEATAGKNPVTHAGKIYNVLAKLTSEKIYDQVKGVREVYVKYLSRIGMPIDEPAMVSVQLNLEDGVALSQLKPEIEGIIEEELSGIRKVTDMIVNEEVMLF